MPVPLYEVEINGVDRNPLKDGFSFSAVMNGVSQLSCSIDSDSGAYRPPLDDEIVFSEDGTPRFGGIIRGTEEVSQIGWGSDIVTSVEAAGFAVYATFKRVRGVTLASGSLEDQLTTVAGWLAEYGVSLHASQATGPTMPALTIDNGRIDEVLNALATASGWFWTIDAAKALRMRAPGSDSAPISISPTTQHVVGDITVRQQRSGQYANRVTAISPPEQRFEHEDTFIGDGSTTTFALTGQVTRTYGGVWNGENFETLGTATDPATWTISGNQITRTSAPAFGAIVRFVYDGLFSAEAVAEDAGDIAANGLQEIVIDAAPGLSVTALQAIADGYLARSLAQFLEVQFNSYATGLEIGQAISINEPYRNINGSFLITEVGGDIDLDDDQIRYRVKAISAAVYQGSWRDIYDLWAGRAGAVGGGVVGGLVASGVATHSGSITLGSSSAYDPAGAVKFVRNDVPADTGDIFAVYSEGDTSHQYLSAENTIVPATAANREARTRLIATGYLVGGAPAPAAIAEVQSGPGGLSRFRVLAGTGPQAHILDGTQAYHSTPIVERGRSFFLGEWTTVAHSAGNFTGANAMTWSVSSGDQADLSFTVIGKTMILAFAIQTSSVGGTPDPTLRIAIPGGYQAARVCLASIDVYDAGWTNGVASVNPAINAGLLFINRNDRANFSLSTDLTYVFGQITFEIQ